MLVAKQQIPNMRQWTGWKAVFSTRSAPMAVHATMDRATEEWCFPCSPFLGVLSRAISECSAVRGNELVGDFVSWRTAVQSL
jgi:hypothetical protein